MHLLALDVVVGILGLPRNLRHRSIIVVMVMFIRLWFLPCCLRRLLGDELYEAHCIYLPAVRSVPICNLFKVCDPCTFCTHPVLSFSFFHSRSLPVCLSFFHTLSLCVCLSQMLGWFGFSACLSAYNKVRCFECGRSSGCSRDH